jgi:hypothetical protein
MQERRIPTLELIRKDVLPLNPSREHHQREATMLGEDKIKNGKRNPEIVRETQITGKKVRNLSNKETKLEKLQGVVEKTSQGAYLQNLNLIRTT